MYYLLLFHRNNGCTKISATMVARKSAQQWLHENHRNNGCTKITATMVARKSAQQWLHENQRINGCTKISATMVARKSAQQWLHERATILGSTYICVRYQMNNLSCVFHCTPPTRIDCINAECSFLETIRHL